MRRLGGGRYDGFRFRRQVEHYKVTPFGRQHTDNFPVPDHQQDIPELQRFIHNVAVKRGPAPAQTQHIQTVTGTEADIPQAFADKLTFRVQGHFRHAHVAGVFGKIFAAQDHRLQHLLGTKFA